MERRFYEGYQEARDLVYKMNEDQLLEHIDSLYGRENLPELFNIDDLRNEALEQTRLEYQTPFGKEQKEWADRFAKAAKNSIR
jgi:hypothetical protein